MINLHAEYREALRNVQAARLWEGRQAAPTNPVVRRDAWDEVLSVLTDALITEWSGGRSISAMGSQWDAVRDRRSVCAVQALRRHYGLDRA